MQSRSLCARSFDPRGGFSLVELSIVVAILSVVATLGLEVAASFVNRTAYSATQEAVSAADTALKQFATVYGRLPCPAKQVIGPLDATLQYGREDCAIGIFPGTGIGGGVIGGALPFRTLNLPMSASLDGFGNKLQYYVTFNLTQAGAGPNQFGDSPAGIEVRTGNLGQPCITNCSVLADPVAVPSTGAAYVIFSHGADKRGAHARNGTLQLPCVPTPPDQYESRVDSQNCAAAQLPFVPTLKAGGSVISIPLNVVYDSRFNTGSIYDNYFDDVIVWHTKGQL